MNITSNTRSTSISHRNKGTTTSGGTKETCNSCKGPTPIVGWKKGSTI